MAIAAALNIIVRMPSEQLRKDAAFAGTTVKSFEKTLRSYVKSVEINALDAEYMAHLKNLSLGFNKGAISCNEMTIAHRKLREEFDKKKADVLGTNIGGAPIPGVDWQIQEKKAAILKEQERLKAEALVLDEESLALNKKHASTFERMAADIQRINTLKAHGLSDDAARHMMGEATGTTAASALAAAESKRALAAAEALHNQRLARGAALTATVATAEEVLNAATAEYNGLLAANAITQETHNRLMQAATRAYGEQTSVMARMGFSVKGLRAALGFLNPWLVATVAGFKGIKEGAQFEKSMDRVQALAGASSRQIAELTMQADQLGRTTVFSAKDAAEGMAALAKASFKTQEIIDAMPATMRLAAIGEMEVGDAAEIAARVMAGMKIPATELSDVVDSLAVAATNSVNTVEQLGEAMKFVGPAAKQAGYDIDQTMSGLMMLGDAGMSGELGGTAMRNIFFRMSKQTKEGKAALAELGVSFHTLEGDVLPLLSIIQQFEKALDGMSSGEKMRLLGQIFQTRSATGFAAMLGGGSSKMAENMELLSQKEGIAEKMAQALNDNFLGDLEMLGSAISSLAISIYESGVGDSLRFLAIGVTQIVDSFAVVFHTIMYLVDSAMWAVAETIASVLELVPEMLRSTALQRYTEDSRTAANQFAQGAAGHWASAGAASHEMDELGNRAFGRNQQTVDSLQAEQAAIDKRLQSSQELAMADRRRNEAAQHDNGEVLKQLGSWEDAIAKLKGQTDDQIALEKILRSSAAESYKEKARSTVAQLEYLKETSDLEKKIADARLAARTVGETSGQKFLASIFERGGTPTYDQFTKANRLDHFEKLTDARTESKRLKDSLTQSNRELALGANNAKLLALAEMGVSDAVLKTLSGLMRQHDVLERMSKLREEYRKSELDLDDPVFAAWQEMFKTSGGQASLIQGAFSGLGMGTFSADLAAALTSGIQSNKKIKTGQDAFDDLEQQAAWLNYTTTIFETWGREADKWDEVFKKISDSGVAGSMLKAAADLIEQIRALEKAAEARKKEREELEKTTRELMSNAEDVKKKFDALFSFTERFKELSIMKQAGLIDNQTFNKAVKDARLDALKSAGPKNIGFAAAAEQGSAEAYRASLPTFANPEYEELKKQTKLAETSGKTLSGIRTGVEKFNKGQELIEIGPP